MNYLEKFSNRGLVSQIFIDSYLGRYHCAHELKTPAVSFAEMMARIEHYAIERLSLPHVTESGDFAHTYEDMALLLTISDSDETKEFAREIAKAHPLPKESVLAPAIPATDGQKKYLTTLGHTKDMSSLSKTEAASLIGRMKK